MTYAHTPNLRSTPPATDQGGMNMSDVNTTSLIILIGINIGLTIISLRSTRRIRRDIEHLRRELAQRHIHVN